MNDKKFNPQRLIEAQALKGITNAEIAETVGVTTDMVSKWRRGIAPPRDANVAALADALGVPSVFLFRSEKPVDLSQKILRRAKSRRTQKEDDAGLFFIEYFYEGMENILGRFQVPQVDLPLLHIKHPLDLEKSDIEEIAMQIRHHWGLGGLPIRTFANLLFSKGILVQRVEMEWDGVSFIENGIPVILIKDGQEKSRDKTTIGHEFGHIVLHHRNPHLDPTELSKAELKILEDQAFFLGTCMTMPREFYLRDVYKTSYQCLKQIKPKWQTSISCQIMHLGALECITADEKAALFKSMNWNQRGGSKKEPMEDQIIFEECDFLSDAIKNLDESGNRGFVDQTAQIFPNVVAHNFRKESAVVIDFPFNLPPTFSETSA